MARVHIDFPEHVQFTTVISVRITDLNYGNHLGNDAVLSLMHEARVRFLQHFGYSELDVAGVGIIMSDAAIQFKKEAFYGDELTIEIATGDFTRVAFDMYYRLKNNQQEIVVAKTGIVCFDYALRKVAPVPEAFVQRMQTGL